MNDERWGYADSKDAEAWTGAHPTREEAVAEGRRHYSYLTEYGRHYDGFWIHSGHLVPLEAVMPDVDDIIETMGERAYDEAGEPAEEYPDVTNEARVELEGLLRGWCERYAMPTFWVADGVAEFIPAEEVRAAEQTEAGAKEDDILIVDHGHRAFVTCGEEHAPAPSPARDEVREAAEEWAAAEAEYDAVPAYSRDTDAFGRNMFRRQSARRRLLAALSSPPAAPAKDEVREAAEVRYATRPSRDDRRVPYCDEQCPQHDGKRCRLMGVQPSSICEPEVLNLIAAIAARSTTRGGQP